MMVLLKVGLFRRPVVLAIALTLLIFPGRLLGQSEAVDDETCLTCHDGVDRTLAHTPHRLAMQNNGSAIKVACVSCHAGGEVHIEDPSTENIVNPANLSGQEASALCSTCHTVHRELDNFGFDAHSSQELNCAECHQVHGTKASLLLDDQSRFCTRCHQEMTSKALRRSNHPINQGVVTCLDCHSFTKLQDAKLSFELDRLCQDCHPDQAGPFPFEHAAVNGYAVDGGGCLDCHNPHGSENDHLLKQPQPQLCNSCHGGHMTRHHGNLWDDVWSEYACQTCHSDLHGSYDNAQLLDPNMDVKFSGDCFNAGCHSTGGQGGF